MKATQKFRLYGFSSIGECGWHNFKSIGCCLQSWERPLLTAMHISSVIHFFPTAGYSYVWLPRPWRNNPSQRSSFYFCCFSLFQYLLTFV